VQTPDDDEPTKDVTFELALDEGPTYASVLTALKAGWHVKVELTYSFTRSIGGYYSDSIGDKRTFVMTSISLKDDEPEEITVKRVAHAFLHEFSHALKLVKESETKKGNASDKNPLHYTGNGGQGPHCAWEVDKSKAGAYKPKPKEAGKKLCIMFHNLVPDRDGEFCPTCLGQLQRGSVKIPQT
ncbi:MAG: hypothetical protein JST92_27365, partial [Deltaproteobacteria bacterium]|nr:hypothetical protein [Deltaproteobacteria bacterium]